jgi:hypothetical protein
LKASPLLECPGISLSSALAGASSAGAMPGPSSTSEQIKERGRRWNGFTGVEVWHRIVRKTCRRGDFANTF